MEKITYRELTEAFRKHERAAQGASHITGCIVFTEDNFGKPCSLDARTYRVSSDNKAYQPDRGGYSIYGSSLDGRDPAVRLERYMALEKGGRGGWKVNYCYLEK